MENKYFTPDIEDFYVGYEYEYEDIIPSGSSDYFKSIISKPSEIENLFKEFDAGMGIRVPYLTKEQIEAEGWKECILNDNEQALLLFSKNGYDLRIYEDYIYRFSELIVGAGMMPCWDKVLFEGECKDINTFRKIIKLLKI